MDHKELNGNGEIILVIDDEPEILSVVEGILEKFNYKTVCVRTFSAGVEYFKDNNEIDLILMDYTVVDPNNDITASQTITQFKDIRSDIKIVIMSGHMIKNDEMIKTNNLGVKRLLAKPFNFEELTRLIKEVLES